MPSILARTIPASARPPHRRGPPPDQSPRWQSCQEHSLGLAVPKEAGPGGTEQRWGLGKSWGLELQT